MEIFPSLAEFKAAIPGLALVIGPIIFVSEFVYWLENGYTESVLHISAPVIPLMIAAIIAIIITNMMELSEKYSVGMQFATRWLLRAGIVFYGFNFSYALWLRPNSQSIFIIGLVAVAVPLVAGYFFGRLLRLQGDGPLLVAVGTAICGISAIIATQQATKSDEKDAGLSIATILFFGTIVLFTYPIVDRLLGLSGVIYGTWTGATTLDLPQLVAAALQGDGAMSLQSALWVKSIRIGLLVPVILLLVASRSRSKMLGERNRHPYRDALRAFPLFIIAFFGVILGNTLFTFPSWLVGPIATGSREFLNLSAASLLLTAAIIAICFRVRVKVIGRTGWKFVILGGLIWGLQSLLILPLATILGIS